MYLIKQGNSLLHKKLHWNKGFQYLASLQMLCIIASNELSRLEGALVITCQINRGFEENVSMKQ